MKKRILHLIFGVAFMGIIGLNLNINIDRYSGNLPLSSILRLSIAYGSETPPPAIKATCAEKCTRKVTCSSSKGTYSVSGGGYICCHSGAYAGLTCAQEFVN